MIKLSDKPVRLIQNPLLLWHKSGRVLYNAIGFATNFFPKPAPTDFWVLKPPGRVFWVLKPPGRVLYNVIGLGTNSFPKPAPTDLWVLNNDE